MDLQDGASGRTKSRGRRCSSSSRHQMTRRQRLASLARAGAVRIILLAPGAPASPVSGEETPQQEPPPPTPRPTTRADILRGEYGRYRVNNDLLYYHLDIRVDPDKRFISGKNTIRFK